MAVMMFLLCMCSISYISAVSAYSNENLEVYWPMNGDAVGVPEFSTDIAEWTFDTSDLDDTNIIDGALFLNEDKLDLRSDIKRTCLHQLNMCTDGLTLAFWLKVNSWRSGAFPTLFTTTNAGRTLPGIYIGGVPASNNIELIYWDARGGKKYTAQFPFVLETWKHVAITWTSDVGFEVALDGVLVDEDGYTMAPTMTEVDIRDVSLTDFEAGNTVGPDFGFDDLFIYYRSLEISEILDLPEVGVGASTTSTTSSTIPGSTTPSSTTPSSTTPEPTTLATTTTSPDPSTAIPTSGSTSTTSSPEPTTGPTGCTINEVEYLKYLEKYKEALSDWQVEFSDYQNTDDSTGCD